MPSFQRRVSFTSSPPVYSRLPRDDEDYVIRAFARHASHCASCSDPYAVHRSGGTLCPKGHQRALDVAQYIFCAEGRPYSLIDAEGAHQRVQVEIPIGCESVRSLLRAMERGLRIMKRPPSTAAGVFSYDRTYWVPPRQPVHRHPDHVHHQPQQWQPHQYHSQDVFVELVEPTTRSKTAKVVAPRDYSGRGSMFARDMKEREEYFQKQPRVYFRAIAGDAPPVPPKDYRKR